MLDTPELELDVYVSFPEDTNLQQTAHLIEQRLQQLPTVEQVEAIPEQVRMTGLEVIATIGIT